MKKFRWLLLFAGMFLMIIMPLMNQGEAVISTFDSDLDGWTGSGNLLTWADSIGDPPGSLCSQDTGGNFSQIIAPVKFLGNWESYTKVSVDIFAQEKSGFQEVPGFAISNGTTSYQYIFATSPVGGTWQEFSASLNDFTLITAANASGWLTWAPPIGVEPLSEVLNNINTFRIRTDYRDGAELAYLDNIMVIAPLPSTLIIFGSGLAGLGLWSRREKL